MKKLAALLMLGTAVLAPDLAFARDISISARVASYYGAPAYLAIYITNPDGSYNSTIWVAGSRTRYYQHLRQWARGISAAGGGIDGITGASVGSGQSLTINASIADTLIDAGYEIHVDSAVENGGEYSSDVVMPLDQASSGVPASGPGYVASLLVTL